MAHGQTQAHFCTLLQHPRAMMSPSNDRQVTAERADRRISLLSDQDLYLFNEGSNYRAYEKLGAHLIKGEVEAGATFAVWAPAARRSEERRVGKECRSRW